MTKVLVIELDQPEIDQIESAAEISGLSPRDFVEMSIMEAVDNALAVYDQDDDDDNLVTNVSFTPLEISLIEYAAGFNGLNVAEKGRGLNAFIHRAVMEAVGEAVDSTIDHSSAYSPLVVSVQARQCERELFEKAADQCGVSLDEFVLRSAYYTARELLED